MSALRLQQTTTVLAPRVFSVPSSILVEGAPRRRRMHPEGEIPSPPRPSQPAGIESWKAPVNGKSGADERAVRERCSEPFRPEPYAVSREAGGGAMARARIGWVLSSVIAIVGGADAVKTGGRQDSARRYARWAGTSRSRRPHACAEPLFAGTGRSLARPRQVALWAASQSR